MRVLYCLDGTNVAEVSQARAMLSASEPQTLGILYVIDSGPREDLGRVRERFFRRPVPSPSREEEILQTERASAKDILEEGLRHLPDAEPLERQGRPEREIVNGAAEWRADLLVICPRSQYGASRASGQNRSDMSPDSCWITRLARCFWSALARKSNSRSPGKLQSANRTFRPSNKRHLNNFLKVCNRWFHSVGARLGTPG